MFAQPQPYLVDPPLLRLMPQLIVLGGHPRLVRVGGE